MPEPSKHTKARLKFIDDAEANIAGGIKKVQAKLWDKVDKIINRLRVEEGRISSSAANYSLLSQLNAIQKEIKDGPKRELVKQIVSDLLAQETLVRKYFRDTLKLKRDKVEDRVHRQLLNRIGYDGDGFVSRGTLHDLWTDDTDMRAIRAQTVKAIAAGQSWSEFQTQMRTLVVGSDEKLGITEANFRTITRDMYAQNDRAITKHYADELEMGNFIFQGGLMNTTRPFCRSRNNRIFTREEVEEWSKLDFEGKPAVYDPFLDVGGYNCRHVLDPISDELAKELRGESGETDGDEPRSELVPDIADKLKLKLKTYQDGISEDFLKVMPEFEIKFSRSKAGQAHYSPADNEVFLNKVAYKRGVDRQILVYHEFTHAFHFRRGLITEKAVNKQLEEDFNAIKKKFLDKDIDLAAWEQKMRDRDKELYFDFDNPRRVELRRNLTAVTDTIQALTKEKYGWGHKSNYYRRREHTDKMEFFAHASENKFVGNSTFKKEFPELYQDMIEFATKYLK